MRILEITSVQWFGKLSVKAYKLYNIVALQTASKAEIVWWTFDFCPPAVLFLLLFVCLFVVVMRDRSVVTFRMCRKYKTA